MPCSIQCRQHRRYTCRSRPVWTRCNTGFALFHRTNRHYLGCVGYVCVGRRRSYQNRGETLLGQGRVCFGDFKYPHWLPEIAYPNFNDCFSSTAHIHNDNLIMFNLHYMWGDFKTICRLCKYNNVTKFVIYGKKEAGTGEHSTHFNNKINKHKWKAAAPHGRLPHTKHKLKFQAWSSLFFHCCHSSFNPSEAPPWDSRPVSGAGVVHYQLLHRPRSVPTALSPAPLVTNKL